MPTTTIANCPCCQQSGSGSGSGSGSTVPVTTVVCAGDAVEVPTSLTVALSGGVGTLACLNGLAYGVQWNAVNGNWNGPTLCLCVDLWTHKFIFDKTCAGSPSVPAFNLGVSLVSAFNLCGNTGTQVFFTSPGFTTNYTGNGASFVWVGTMSDSATGDTITATVSAA